MLESTPAAKVMPISPGRMTDFTNTEFPTIVYGFNERITEAFEIDGPGTMYGYVSAGSSFVFNRDGRKTALSRDCYFSLPVRERAKVLGGAVGFIAFRRDYIGLDLVGRDVEERGRLKYIDGCSDTLLISPPLKGDPCLNLLHFPKGISQTKHTHPSIRVGMIHKGWGLCHTARETSKLATGSMFILWPDAIHAFETTESEMQLTVYHPDSDFGPTHEAHPMLNRTIVDGVSAKDIDAIRTQVIQ